jgi:2-iminobutanoate/2-iminopropanoate deaminase
MSEGDVTDRKDFFREILSSFKSNVHMRLSSPFAGAFVTASLLLASCAATPMNATGAAKSCFHRSESVEIDIGYCQAIRSGNTLHISGSVGQGDMPAAMRKAYDTIRQTLDANGLEFRDVVKENVFVTDLDAFIRNKDIRKEYYAGNFPAASWVQVQRLYLPAFVVEVEVTAEYPIKQ